MANARPHHLNPAILHSYAGKMELQCKLTADTRDLWRQCLVQASLYTPIKKFTGDGCRFFVKYSSQRITRRLHVELHKIRHQKSGFMQRYDDEKSIVFFKQ